MIEHGCTKLENCIVESSLPYFIVVSYLCFSSSKIVMSGDKTWKNRLWYPCGIQRIHFKSGELTVPLSLSCIESSMSLSLLLSYPLWKALECTRHERCHYLMGSSNSRPCGRGVSHQASTIFARRLINQETARNQCECTWTVCNWEASWC
jgi:hypothetical protein